MELTERDLDYAIHRGLQLWDKHKPFRARLAFDTQAAVTTIIDLSEQEQAGVIITRVGRVQFKSKRTLLGQQAAPLPVGELYWDARGPRIYFQLRISEVIHEHFTGTGPDWYWEPEERKLYIYSPRQPFAVLAEVTRRRHISEISPGDEHEFEQYIVAVAQLQLAKAKGQLGAIPHPSGEVNPNSQFLGDDAKEKMREVEERLSKRPNSVPVPRWI